MYAARVILGTREEGRTEEEGGVGDPTDVRTHTRRASEGRRRGFVVSYTTSVDVCLS